MTTTRAWVQQLQAASFRGISFKVGDTETVFGRRNVTHEYPLRDDTYAEDLGMKAREFTINAYIIGDNYRAVRDQLIEAIETNATPGILIHPTLGMRMVTPKQCRVSFNNSEGGWEKLVLLFTDAGKQHYPTSIVDTPTNSNNVANASIEAAANAFSALFNVNGFNQTINNQAINSLLGTAFPNASTYAATARTSFVGAISSALTQGSNFASLGNTPAFTNQMTHFIDQAPSIVTQPLALALSISELITALAAIFAGNPKQALLALTKLFSLVGLQVTIPITLATVPVVTANRSQLALNQQQLLFLVQVCSCIEMVRSMSLMTFASRQDALTTMAMVNSSITPTLAALGNSANNAMYDALNTARVAMVLDITTRAATLATVTYVTLNHPIPAVVLAYRQYQDAKQAEDIISRNKIANPGFVPSGVPIEILVGGTT